MSERTVKKRHRRGATPCYCRCGCPLGFYLCAFIQIGDGAPRLSLIDSIRRYDEGTGYVLGDEGGVQEVGWVSRLGAQGKPRTTGLFPVRFNGQEYVRVICPRCHRDETRRAEDIREADFQNQDGVVVLYV